MNQERLFLSVLKQHVKCTSKNSKTKGPVNGLMDAAYNGRPEELAQRIVWRGGNGCLFICTRTNDVSTMCNQDFAYIKTAEVKTKRSIPCASCRWALFAMVELIFRLCKKELSSPWQLVPVDSSLVCNLAIKHIFASQEYRNGFDYPARWLKWCG